MTEELRIERHEPDIAWPEVEKLGKIVYTPELEAADEWGHIDWSHAESWLMGYLGDALVSCAGIHQRHAKLDGEAALMAGIGGVKTHPDFQKRGYSTQILNEIYAVIDEKIAPAFSAIFVEDHNRAFYHKRGWRVFGGDVLMMQHGNQTAFQAFGVMLRDGTQKAPEGGVIDLLGNPW